MHLPSGFAIRVEYHHRDFPSSCGKKRFLIASAPWTILRITYKNYDWVVDELHDSEFPILCDASAAGLFVRHLFYGTSGIKPPAGFCLRDAHWRGANCVLLSWAALAADAEKELFLICTFGSKSGLVAGRF